MKYRGISHVIAYLDVVVTVLEVTLAVGKCLAYIFGWMSIEEDERDNIVSSSKDYDERLFQEILTVVMIAEIMGILILGAVQMFGAYKLIQGTNQDVSPYEGLSCCRTWRNITFVLFALLIPYMIYDAVNGHLQKDFVLIVIFVILRIAALLVVKQYMNQLQTTIPTVIEMESPQSDGCRLINK